MGNERMSLTVHKCAGCGRDLSLWATYLHPEPSEYWHTSCWGFVDWHVDDVWPPRPMTPAEKSAYIEKHKIVAAMPDGTCLHLPKKGRVSETLPPCHIILSGSAI